MLMISGKVYDFLLLSDSVFVCDFRSAFRLITGDASSCGRLEGRLVVFIVIENTEICFVDHMVIAFDISSFACIDYILRDISGVVRSEQIVLVVFADVRIFGSDIYSSYLRALFLEFGHDFKTQRIEIAPAAKQKGISISVVDKG